MTVVDSSKERRPDGQIASPFAPMRRDREVMSELVIARSEATTASTEALRAKAEAIHTFFAAKWIASLRSQ
jgi:hypothetical protein